MPVVTQLMPGCHVTVKSWVHGGGIMNESSSVGMLKLKVGASQAAEYTPRAVEEIQQLPGVLRVRWDGARYEMEIIYRTPATGLLRAIHHALRQAGGQVLAGKAY